MKLAVTNCTVVFDVVGKNINYIEIQKEGQKPHRINLRVIKTTPNVASSSSVMR